MCTFSLYQTQEPTEKQTQPTHNSNAPSSFAPKIPGSFLSFVVDRH